MSLYLVGDVQGCFSELQALLKQVNFDKSTDQLYLAGDIVARGKQSLETLRFVKSLGNTAKMVLGNHDLHLLAIHAKLKKAKKNDFLDNVLTAPDCNELMDWLAQQPLLIKLPNENAYMSHAGISPQWTIEQAVENAEFVQNLLRTPQRKIWLAAMYGEQPNNWHDVHTDTERFRFTINAFSRMRFCFDNNALEFNHKDTPEHTDKKLIPWYELSPVLNNTSWIFGHWASLMGKCSRKNVYALDTGCVWGNHLTMLRWHDKKLFSEKAH